MILEDVLGFVVKLFRILVMVLVKFVWIVVMGLIRDLCVGVCFNVDGGIVGVLWVFIFGVVL